MKTNMGKRALATGLALLLLLWGGAWRGVVAQAASSAAGARHAAPLALGAEGQLDFCTPQASLNDMAGEGWAWTRASRTLVLTDLSHSCAAVEALLLPHEATLVLNGSSTLASTSAAESTTSGIYAMGDLTIRGNGSLHVTGGTSNGMIIEHEGSSGIHVVGRLTVEDSARVTACGGPALLGGESEALSMGVYCQQLLVRQNAQLTALGGASQGLSCGVVAEMEFILAGGRAEFAGAQGAPRSYGLYGGGSGTVTGGVWTARGDTRALHMVTATNPALNALPIAAAAAYDGTGAAPMNRQQLQTGAVGYRFVQVGLVAPAGHTVALAVRRDGAPYTAHGKAFTLRQGSAVAATGTGAGGAVAFANVADGSYQLYDGEEDTGRTVVVAGADANAALDYYTVAFAAQAVGAAQSAAITATYGGAAVATGQVVLGGGQLVLQAAATGADSYRYAWSGAGTAGETGDTLVLTGLSTAVNALCTITGQWAPSLQAAPATVAFGSTEVGQTATPVQVTVTASHLAQDITVAVPPGFSWQPAAGWNARTGGPLTLHFAPGEARDYGGQVAITAGTAQCAVTVSGRGVVVPRIDEVTASPPALGAAGGTVRVAVLGQHLPAGVAVQAFLGDVATGIGGATGADGAASLNFTPNSGVADQTYTLKASLDGGATWAAATATVVVARPVPQQADPQHSTVTPTGLDGAGTPAAPFLATVGQGFSLQVQGHRQSAPGTTVGDTRLLPHSWQVNPSGTFPAGGPYIIQAALSAPGNYNLVIIYREERWDGTAWVATGQLPQQTLAIRVQAAGVPVPDPGLPPVAAPQPGPAPPAVAQQQTAPADEAATGPRQPFGPAPQTGDAATPLAWLAAALVLALALALLWRGRRRV